MNALAPSPPRRGTARPRAWRYMLEALLPKAHGSDPISCGLRVEWTAYRVRPRDIDAFVQLCGLPAPAASLPPLFLHAISFRAQMALLTRHAFPLPIWRVLQVRNRLADLEAVRADETLDFRCAVYAQRAVARGIEIDLETRIERSADARLLAHSVNTFYVRGGPHRGGVAPVPDAPAVTEGQGVAWHVPRGGGFAFGRLTGDYNGIHFFDGYARRFGFRRAFLHPLRVVAQALAHAPDEVTRGACTTEIWMKGPVYHDGEVRMRIGRDAARSCVLAVHAEPDPRPAIVVRRSS